MSEVDEVKKILIDQVYNYRISGDVINKQRELKLILNLDEAARQICQLFEALRVIRVARASNARLVDPLLPGETEE